LVFNTVQAADAGDYYCLINSNIVTDLTLIRNPIHLNINPEPIANPIASIRICDDNNDGYANFVLDISNIESQLLATQTGLAINYFDTLGNPITLTNTYTNTTPNTQTITARVTNSNNCYKETSFDLIVNPTPQVDTINNQVTCDNYMLPNLTDGDYYTLPNGTGTPLNSGDLISISQTIFIYNESNGCSNESSFDLTITATPTVDILNNEIACDSFTLQPLTTGNYYTASAGTGTSLNAGDEISTSQTIYIYETNGNCSDESSFNITINTTPSVDTLANEIACDSYTLLPLTNGNYYTGTNGTGTQLNAGDEITTTQTIYVYAETATTPICRNESSFEIVILATPVVDMLNNVSACEAYALPALTNGNYFSGANGSGTPLNAGDMITTTQTIYIYTETTTTPICRNESSFIVTINNTPTADILSNQFACDSFELPNLTIGNYFTGTNGTGTALNAGDMINTTQTIYIFAETQTTPNCSNESSFEIRILETPEVDLLDNVFACDTYALPVLTNGNYFSGTNATGTPLNAGDIITRSQSIFIYAEIGTTPQNCIAEHEFMVTITTTRDFDLSDANIDINNQDITINMTDLSIDYEYAVDGSDFQDANNFSNLAEGNHTLYVRDTSSCVEKFISLDMVSC